MRRSTREVATNHWHHILLHFGLTEDQLRIKKQQPCPACAGEDRYAYLSNETGWYRCRACTPDTGDGFTLIEKVTGKDFATAAKEIDELMSNKELQESPPAPPKPDYTNYIREICKDLLPPENTPVQTYLKARGLDILPNVKYHPDLPYYQDRKKIGIYPAMVGGFKTASDKLAGLHLTYLAQDGSKAIVEHVKKTVPMPCGMKGSAIRLTDIGPSLYIAEGIETACAVIQIYKKPCWAVGNDGGMKSFKVPEHVKALTICADNDKNKTHAGLVAAIELWRRVKKEGVKCRILMPEEGDMLDAMLKGCDIFAL